MSWKTWRVVLRLHSLLHVGRGKVGNLQRTRHYVTGRVLWGALTERRTRDTASGPATGPELYQRMGERVHDALTFTYLYATTHDDGTIDPWPWADGFRARFLSTYASTALTYPRQSAEEGSLHEVECIVPYTLDRGQPVYLAGYVIERDGAPDWRSALHRLRIGGERGYGWGQVEPVLVDALNGEGALFGDLYTIDPDGGSLVLAAKQDAPLLAHALATAFEGRRAVKGVDGEVEPLVGRETSSGRRFGQSLSQARICYAPGSQVQAGARFRVGPYGVWEAA